MPYPMYYPLLFGMLQLTRSVYEGPLLIGILYYVDYVYFRV